MSAKRIDDGGPAFPVEVSADSEGWLVGRQTGNQSGFATGISIRDYFAAKAMSGWMATYPEDQSFESIDCTEVAVLSYRIADAMLKVRAE